MWDYNLALYSFKQKSESFGMLNHTLIRNLVVLSLATNNFMMNYFGQYKVTNETHLLDDVEETCVDLDQIWSSGPMMVNYRTVWGNSPSFNVTILINDNLSSLLHKYSRKEASMEVLVGKEEPFDGTEFGSFYGFRRCERGSPWTYRCTCELHVCSVFVTVTIRDRSIIPENSSLKMCEIFISA